MLKKKIIVSCLSFSLFACLFATSYHVKAVDFEGKESQYIKLCSSSKLTNSQQKTCKEFNNYLYDKNKELKEEASQAKEDAQNTKEDIAQIAQKITEIDTKIESAESELDYVQKNIEKLKKEVQEQSEKLQERLYSMQTTLNSNIFTTYIFGADTISDFMSRIINIKEITNYDNELIDQINENIKEVQKQETTLKNLKASLEDDKKEQASLQKTFQAKLTEQNKTVASNTSQAAKNQESIESIQKNLAAIQKASDASKVNHVSQATPNKKPSSSQSTQKPSQNESSNTNDDSSQKEEQNQEENNTSSDSNLSSNEELGLAIANKALTRRDYMYVWGGCHTMSEVKNPNQTKFDCSGLVCWAHYQCGVNIGVQSTKWNLATAGKSVSKANIQAGDIVVVRGHVGIAAGGGMVIDASSSNGRVVHRSLSQWWANNFICAWRIF